MTTQTFSDAQIAEAAFYIWLEEGQPEGRDQAHWLAAQAQLKAKAQSAPKKRTAAKPKAAKAAAAKTADAKPKAPAKPRARKAAAKPDS